MYFQKSKSNEETNVYLFDKEQWNEILENLSKL
jgi:hypothetical protein